MRLGKNMVCTMEMNRSRDDTTAPSLRVTLSRRHGAGWGGVRRIEGEVTKTGREISAASSAVINATTQR